MISKLIAILRDESGQDLVEYSLVVALLGLGAITAMKTLSSSISTAFSQVGEQLTSVT